VLWRQSSGRLPIVWGVIILIAGFTANALAWITLSAEDVPELIAAAPIADGEVVRVKLEAALLPILPLVLLPMLFLWRSHAWFGFSVTVCAAGAAVCSAALNVRERAPGRRRDFRTRHKGRPGRGFIELGVVAAWAGICALMVSLSPWR
jgi:ABC-2 type transport system permease protein